MYLIVWPLKEEDRTFSQRCSAPEQDIAHENIHGEPYRSYECNWEVRDLLLTTFADCGVSTHWVWCDRKPGWADAPAAP